MIVRAVLSPIGKLLPVLWVVLAAAPAGAESYNLSFSGEITDVLDTAPAPFEQTAVGDAWTLIYTFETTGAIDVDGSPLAGQYRDTVTFVSLTIGAVSESGAPAGVVPSDNYSSNIFVNLGEGSADYGAQLGLPATPAWAQVSFSDVDGTPFTSDALPTSIPGPYTEVFPTYQQFTLRQPGSSWTYLRGVVGDGEVGDLEVGTLSGVRADIVIAEDGQGLPVIELVVNTELFGVEGVAVGLLACPGCEVMGVEPSPFDWFVDPETGPAGEDTAVVSIRPPEPGSDVMGVEPSPFRLLLDAGLDGLGLVDFSEAWATFSGPLGALRLEGVRLHFWEGTVVDLDGFDVYDAVDSVTFVGPRVAREVRFVPEGVAYDLIVDEPAFGPGGLGSGLLDCPGCAVMGVEPSPFRWVARDPTGGDPPSPGSAAVTVELDATGAVSGLGESPFIVYLEADGLTVAELAFVDPVGQFPGMLGALSLGGLGLILPDDSMLPVEYLDIYDLGDQFTLINTEIDLRLSTDLSRADLVVSSARFGPEAFASGGITSPGLEVMGVEPSPFRWVVDLEFGIVDGQAAVSYLSAPGGEVMGVEPSPFRYLMVDAGNEILGDVDFGQSYAQLGSFYLFGLDVGLADGSPIAVLPIQTAGETTYQVAIDIKPGSDNNSINLSSSGVIPVAILSSPSFDATTVDPETVRLAGASVRLVGNGRRSLANSEDVNGDGLDDLSCKVLTDELSIEVGDSFATLTALTSDGSAITGRDVIRIVPD